MIIGKYISLALLIVDLIIHFYGLIVQNKKCRYISKGFIVPLIICFYGFSTPEVNWLIVVAFIFGWLGDLALILKQKVMFIVGGWLFAIEFILLATVIIGKIQFNNLAISLAVILSTLYFVGIFLFTFKKIKSYVPLYVFIMALIYLTLNSFVNAMTITLLSTIQSPQTIILFIGSTLFLASDLVLVYVKLTSNKKLDPKHIFIMGTYVVAQFLIAFAFI